MDKRDSYNVIHMRRRMIACSNAPIWRKLEIAEHVMAIALKQNRTQLYLMASMWKSQIKKERGNNGN